MSMFEASMRRAALAGELQGGGMMTAWLRAEYTPRAAITPMPATTTAEVAAPVSPPIRENNQQNQSVGGGD